MNFDLTEEQKDIAGAAREFAEGEFPNRAQECDRNEEFPETSGRRPANWVLWGSSSPRPTAGRV